MTVRLVGQTKKEKWALVGIITGGSIRKPPPLAPPTASLLSLVPNTAVSGAGPTSVSVNGTGFDPAAEVLADGTVVPGTNWSDDTQIQAIVVASTPQVVMVTVRNPGEGPTNPVPFTVI